MMKNLILLSLSFVLCLGLQAQNVDGGATPILNKLAGKYAAYTSIKIDYTYKCEKNTKVIDTKTGKMFIKGKKYYFTFGDQTSYCNGKTLWNYQKKLNEISIYDYDEKEDNFLNPAVILSSWNKDYRAKFIREEYDDGKSLQLIDLLPVNASSFYKIRIFIDKSKNEIVKMSAFEKDNTTYTYFVDKMVVNTDIDDSYFMLDVTKYPTADVNDMR